MVLLGYAYENRGFLSQEKWPRGWDLRKVEGHKEGRSVAVIRNFNIAVLK